MEYVKHTNKASLGFKRRYTYVICVWVWSTKNARKHFIDSHLLSAVIPEISPPSCSFETGTRSCVAHADGSLLGSWGLPWTPNPPV